MKRLQILFPYFLFLLTFLLAGYFSRIGLDAHHDGIVLKPAVDVSRGLILFKETFSQYGALTVYLQAWCIKIFGEYLLVLKLLTAFFYALIAVTLYYLWQKILSKNLAFLSVLLWLLLAPFYAYTLLAWSSVYALLFQLLTIIAFLKFAEQKNRQYLCWAGVCTGLTFWFKQNIGLYVLLPSFFLSLFLITGKLKNKLLVFYKTYCLGFLLISLPILILLTAQHALGDWFKQTFLFSVKFAKFFVKRVNLLTTLFVNSKGPISIWVMMPLVTLLIILQEFFKKNITFWTINTEAKKTNINLLIITLFSLASWLQYFPISDIRHTFWAATPMVGVLMYFIWEIVPEIITKAKPKFLKIFCLLTLTLLFFYPDINFRVNEGIKKYQQKYVSLAEPALLQGMLLTPEEKAEILFFYEPGQKYLKDNPSANVMTFWGDALYLLFFNSENFHPMYVNWPTVNYSIYKDYPEIRDKYVVDHQPLIISFDDFPMTGYCPLSPANSINPVSGKKYTTYLIAPCEKIKK